MFYCFLNGITYFCIGFLFGLASGESTVEQVSASITSLSIHYVVASTAEGKGKGLCVDYSK